jgi:hypothetical protein
MWDSPMPPRSAPGVALPFCITINEANRFFENVAQFKYLGINATNRNLIQD